ncbi:MAG TPA: hypothetical protein VHP32_12150 [Ignavibacteria bacterium]|nr:hypothetical protein [Ignavibacteria bacterium]
MKKLKNILPVMVILVSAFFVLSCNEDIVVPPHDVNFDFYPYEYSDGHYFFDTLYKASFLDYYNNTTGTLTEHTIQNEVLVNDTATFEVWIKISITDSAGVFAYAHTMLYEQPVGGYSDTLKTGNPVLGKKMYGRFRRMHPYEYAMHSKPGFIYLKYTGEDDVVAVTYKTSSGKLFGTPVSSAAPNDTLILKLVQWAYLHPIDTPLAWELKLKNVYVLPYAVTTDGFELNVKYYSNGYQTHLPGFSKSISTMLDIDRYTGTTREPPPDGKFDLLEGYTIDFGTNELIFPTLRPFYDNLIREGAGSIYWYPELYTKSKSEAMNVENAYDYRILGKYRYYP